MVAGLLCMCVRVAGSFVLVVAVQAIGGRAVVEFETGTAPAHSSLAWSLGAVRRPEGKRKWMVLTADTGDVKALSLHQVRPAAADLAMIGRAPAHAAMSRFSFASHRTPSVCRGRAREGR